MNREKAQNQDRNAIAMQIAQELLDNEVLDENNFSYDLNALLDYTTGIILKHLEDYMLISGTIV